MESRPASAVADAQAVAQPTHRNVVSATAWTTVGFGLGQVMRLAGNIVLAALLYQEAFALMAVAYAIMQGLTMFSDLGLGPSVVQNRRGDERAFLDTAWTLQVIRGIVLTAIATAISWPLAAFYAQNDPQSLELRWLLPLVTLSTLIAGFNSSKLMTAARHMNVRKLTLIDLTGQTASMGIMIGMAWMTRSVYALAIGGVAGALIHCTLSHLALPGQRNRFRWDSAAARDIVGFGKWLFLSTMITFLAMQVDKLTFARVFPLSEVGVYTIAASLALLTPTLMGRLQSMIAFPMYARALERQSTLAEVLKQSKFPMLALGGYLVALVIAGSQAFVDLAYDDRYAAAGLYIPLLTAGAWFAVIDGIYGAAFLASGRARWVALVNGVKVAAFCALLFPAAKFAGLPGAVFAVAASDAIKLCVALACARTIGLREHRDEIVFTLYVFTVGFGVHWLTSTDASSEFHPLSLLIVQFIVVTAAFAPVLVKVARNALHPMPKPSPIPQ